MNVLTLILISQFFICKRFDGPFKFLFGHRYDICFAIENQMLSPLAFCFKQLVQNCEHHPDVIGKSQYISSSKFSIVAINGDINALLDET